MKLPNLFAKKQYPTSTIEFFCQTKGKTFQVTTSERDHRTVCWWCTSEAFKIVQGEGLGDINAWYEDGTGAIRKLEKVVAPQTSEKHYRHALAQVTASGGTFVLVEQKLPNKPKTQREIDDDNSEWLKQGNRPWK